MQHRTWRRLILVVLGALTLLSLVARIAGRGLPMSLENGGAIASALTGFVLLPWICAALGFFTAWQRVDDRRAWLLLALLIAFGGAFGENPPPADWPTGLRLVAIGFEAALNPSWPIWMLQFGIYFPQRARLDRRWPWLKWLLIAPLAVFTVAIVLAEVGSAAGWGWVDGLAAALTRAQLYRALLGMIAISGFFALLGEQSFTSPSPDARRRIRLLFTGAGIALTPMFVVVGLIESAGYQAGRTELRPGDRLLAYTDGLSEAMNLESEEWGEARMLSAYRGAAALTSAEANAKLMAGADAFAAGAPQHDDMTVVTLHVGVAA